jgi:site-specific recombinase XerD
MRTITLEKGLATFLNALAGKNRSAATIRAYQTDIQQFLSFLHANNVSMKTPEDVEKVDVIEYLSHCQEGSQTRACQDNCVTFFHTGTRSPNRITN